MSPHQIECGVWLLIGISGCAASDRFIAPRSDYALYRETRVASTPQARLGAASRYLKELPDGRFRAEVKSYFDRAEPQFFASAWDRPSQLKAYLRELPQGPHAKEATDRLLEFDLLNIYRARQRGRAESAVSRIENDLVRAEAGRKELIETVLELSRRLSEMRNFGMATGELDHRLIYRFRLQHPKGQCAGAVCEKPFLIQYAVPENKRLSAREARFTLRFELQGGGVERIGVQGPALFSRMSEALDRRPVAEGNLLFRTEAIGRAVQTLENAIEPSLPGRRCAQEVVAPVVLARECEGVRFEARAATEAHEEDGFQISRAVSSAGP